jgi:hypothetical protein
MKKLIPITLLALVCTAALALTPSKEMVTIAAGSVTVSNSTDYAVKRIAQISFTGVLPADTTNTISMIQDGMTQTVATLVGVSGAASVTLTNTTPVYLFKGGRITGTIGTNAGTLRVVFENYP